MGMIWNYYNTWRCCIPWK